MPPPPDGVTGHGMDAVTERVGDTGLEPTGWRHWSRLRRRKDRTNYAVATLSWQELTRSRIAVSTASGCDIMGTWSLSIS